jgi:antitoxin (DNA-binding transcriptional repressor) of toxin-antitoxin stability system
MKRVQNSVGIADVKAHLSELLREVRRGRKFTLLDRKTPVACLIPYTQASEPLPVRHAQGLLRDVSLLPPVRGVESLSALLEERQGSR